MEQVLLEVAVPVEVAAQRLATLEQLALRRGPFPAYNPAYTLAYTPSYTLAYTSRYTRGERYTLGTNPTITLPQPYPNPTKAIPHHTLHHITWLISTLG